MPRDEPLRCTECGEILIRESAITPVGASVFEQQTEGLHIPCPLCGKINAVRWNSQEGFQAVAVVNEESEETPGFRGLFCLSCGSRMELYPPPWKSPTEIIEVRDKAFAICGTCGSRNEIETVEGRTVAVRLA